MINVIILFMFFVSIYVTDETLSWHVWAYTMMFGMLAPFFLSSKTERYVFVTIVLYLFCDYTAFYVLEWSMMCELCSLFTLAIICVLVAGFTNLTRIKDGIKACRKK